MKPLIDYKKFNYDVRFAYDLKPVLYQPEKLEKNFEVYYMFRDVYLSREDYEKIKKLDLRYDFTVIPPAKIGEEFIKTYGHIIRKQTLLAILKSIRFLKVKLYTFSRKKEIKMK